MGCKPQGPLPQLGWQGLRVSVSSIPSWSGLGTGQLSLHPILPGL